MIKIGIMPVLCRAARGLLGWSQSDLAQRSEVVSATIRGYELGHKVPRRASLSSIERTLRQAGVTFASDPKHGVGAFLSLSLQHDNGEAEPAAENPAGADRQPQTV